MEAVDLGKSILKKIGRLKQERDGLNDLAKKRANSLVAYERALAKTIIQLRQGVKFEIDGSSISKPPVTIIEKVARGICWQEAFDKDLSESQHKNSLKILDAIQAELNGLQSVNKHLKDL